MKIAFIIIIALLIVASGLLFYFYEVRVIDKTAAYDSVLVSKRDSGVGYGINYKKRLEIWSFGYDGHGGVIDRRIWPR